MFIRHPSLILASRLTRHTTCLNSTYQIVIQLLPQTGTNATSTPMPAGVPAYHAIPSYRTAGTPAGSLFFFFSTSTPMPAGCRRTMPYRPAGPPAPLPAVFSFSFPLLHRCQQVLTTIDRRLLTPQPIQRAFHHSKLLLRHMRVDHRSL